MSTQPAIRDPQSIYDTARANYKFSQGIPLIFGLLLLAIQIFFILDTLWIVSAENTWANLDLWREVRMLTMPLMMLSSSVITRMLFHRVYHNPAGVSDEDYRFFIYWYGNIRTNGQRWKDILPPLLTFITVFIGYQYLNFTIRDNLPDWGQTLLSGTPVVLFWMIIYWSLRRSRRASIQFFKEA